MNKRSENRFWEIDFFRGIAICMMVLYHFLYDLNYFDIYSIDASSGFWLFFAYVTASTFIFLVGISLSISYKRAKKDKDNFLFSKYLLRGIKIFIWGLLVTFTTWIFIEDEYVIFGILHFIGVAIILSYPFIEKRNLNIILGSISIGLGIYLSEKTFSTSMFFWLGLKPSNFSTVDYFPIFPWIGVVLLGIAFGDTFYTKLESRIKAPKFSNLSLVKAICFLGMYSLFIYLIHQPIILGILYLTTGENI